MKQMRILARIRQLLRGKEEISSAEEDQSREAELDPNDPFPEPVRLEITDVLDLHTFRPDEVKTVVNEYLYQAWHSGFRTARIIHGKGIGVQREIVRRLLERSEYVEGWSDAPSEAGGWGATIVKFRRRRL